MEKRIEILFPVISETNKNRIKEILNITLKDNTKTRQQNADGSYQYVERPTHAQPIQSQLQFHEIASRFTESEE
jgi:polyphosphate kinase